MRSVSSKDIGGEKYKMKYLRDFMIFSRREGKYIRARILILCPKAKEGHYVTKIFYHHINESEKIGDVSVYFNDHGCGSNNSMIEISSYEICRSLYKSLERFCRYGMEKHLLEFFKGLSEASRSPLEEILKRIYYESSYR